MEKLKLDLEVEVEALEKMRSQCPGARWACYQNQALDSANCGHLQFLAVGEGFTFQQAPMQYPDSAAGPGWKYRFVGWVDLASGKVEKDHA